MWRATLSWLESCLVAAAAVAAPGIPGPAALDVREATYFRRSYIDPSPPGACTNATTHSCSNAAARLWVEQRWYAHRSIPSLLVMEVQARMGGGLWYVRNPSAEPT